MSHSPPAAILTASSGCLILTCTVHGVPFGAACASPSPDTVVVTDRSTNPNLSIHRGKSIVAPIRTHPRVSPATRPIFLLRDGGWVPSRKDDNREQKTMWPWRRRATLSTIAEIHANSDISHTQRTGYPSRDKSRLPLRHAAPPFPLPPCLVPLPIILPVCKIEGEDDAPSYSSHSPSPSHPRRRRRPR
jgi:hypothetical protein